MVLEMKAETMQIALILSSYHDDQPPELGGKSHERSAEEGGGGGDNRGVCVLVLQFAMSSMYLLTALKLSQCCAKAPNEISIQENNWKLPAEQFIINPAHSFNCVSFYQYILCLLVVSAHVNRPQCHTCDRFSLKWLNSSYPYPEWDQVPTLNPRLPAF